MQVKQAVIYPESDGKPMADNTKQARWIFILYGNLCALFRAADDVFVAADNLWYPIEGDDRTCMAPDVYVVFGRPKGDRGSYQQWREGDVPLTVVFEVYSPGNDWREMARKLAFYDDHGVEEYYVYDPDTDDLLVYVRGRAALRMIAFKDTFTSPRLGIRFDLTGDEMRVSYPDGTPFLTFEELKSLQERQEAHLAEERLFREAAEKRASNAETRASTAEARASTAEARASTAETRLARIIELGQKARRGTASAEDLAELERLEGEQATA